MEGFAAIFEDLDDPLTGNAARHDLLEIMPIALCTVVRGGTTAVNMAEFAKTTEPLLLEFLTLANGPPSHDTFSRPPGYSTLSNFPSDLDVLWRALPPGSVLSRLIARSRAARLTGPVPNGAAYGQCLGLHGATGPRTSRRRYQVQQDYRCAQNCWQCCCSGAVL